jgi:hypothetical protein
LDAIANVASVLLDDGRGLASDVAQQAAKFTSLVSGLDSLPAQATGSVQLLSVISDANDQIDQATAIVGGLFSAANSIVSNLITAATGAPNTGLLVSTITSASDILALKNSSPTPSSIGETQLSLSQTGSCATCSSPPLASSLSVNIILLPSSNNISKSPPTTPAQLGPAFSTVTIFTALCPLRTTEISTVTETWHSTHYAETATLYSFITGLKAICTETIRYGDEICFPE